MHYARISEALRDLAFERTLTIDEAMDKHFAGDFRHRNSGTGRTRAEFAGMAAKMRGLIEHGTVTVLDEFRDGDRYGERHVIDVALTDGTREHAEIYLIGRYAPDGRFAELHEASVPLEALR